MSWGWLIWRRLFRSTPNKEEDRMSTASAIKTAMLRRIVDLGGRDIENARESEAAWLAGMVLDIDTNETVRTQVDAAVEVTRTGEVTRLRDTLLAKEETIAGLEVELEKWQRSTAVAQASAKENWQAMTSAERKRGATKSILEDIRAQLVAAKKVRAEHGKEITGHLKRIASLEEQLADAGPAESERELFRGDPTEKRDLCGRCGEERVPLVHWVEDLVHLCAKCSCSHTGLVLVRGAYQCGDCGETRAAKLGRQDDDAYCDPDKGRLPECGECDDCEPVLKGQLGQ